MSTGSFDTPAFLFQYDASHDGDTTRCLYCNRTADAVGFKGFDVSIPACGGCVDLNDPEANADSDDDSEGFTPLSRPTKKRRRVATCEKRACGCKAFGRHRADCRLSTDKPRPCGCKPRGPHRTTCALRGKKGGAGAGAKAKAGGSSKDKDPSVSPVAAIEPDRPLLTAGKSAGAGAGLGAGAGAGAATPPAPQLTAAEILGLVPSTQPAAAPSPVAGRPQVMKSLAADDGVPTPDAVTAVPS